MNLINAMPGVMIDAGPSAGCDCHCEVTGQRRTSFNLKDHNAPIPWPVSGTSVSFAHPTYLLISCH